MRRSDKQHHHHQQQRSPIELALPPVHAGARAAPEDFPLPPAPKRRRLGIADAFGQMSLHRRSKLNPALGAQVSLYDSVTSPEESVEAGTGSMVGAGRGPSRNTSFGSSSASGDASTDLELLDSSDVDDESDATSMDEGRTDHLPSLHELSASSTGHQDPVDARIEELIRTSRIRAMVSARREAEGTMATPQCCCWSLGCEGTCSVAPTIWALARWEVADHSPRGAPTHDASSAQAAQQKVIAPCAQGSNVGSQGADQTE